jgi:hypothetical protein
VEGESLNEYSRSWRAWNRHTDDPAFARKLEAVVNSPAPDIDDLAARVETFLLDQALQC